MYSEGRKFSRDSEKKRMREEKEVEEMIVIYPLWPVSSSGNEEGPSVME